MASLLDSAVVVVFKQEMAAVESEMRSLSRYLSAKKEKVWSNEVESSCDVPSLSR